MRKLMWWTIGFSLAISAYLQIVSSSFLVAIVAFLWLISCVRFKEYEPISMIISTALGIFFGLGYINVYHYLHIAPLKTYDDLTIPISATVYSFPEEGKYGNYSLYAEFDVGGKGVKTIFSGDEQLKTLKPGDSFSAVTTFHSSAYNYKGIATDYYYGKGVFLRGSISGEVELQPATKISMRYIPVYIAEKIKETLLFCFDEAHSGLALALVTGNKDKLSEKLSTALSLTGLSHTVAVSGMHLSFLAGLLKAILPAGKWWALGVFSGIILLFMLISGSTASIVRATIMILMLEIAPFLSRERDDPTALSAAVFFILLYNPFALLQVGLYLSVASVASIFLFSTVFYERLKDFFAIEKEDRSFKMKKALLSTISTTCAAMVFTTPIIAYFFDRISLIAPLANVLALFVVSIAFVGSLLVAFVGSFIPILGKIIACCFSPAFCYLLFLLPFLSRSAFSSISIQSTYYNDWFLFVYLMIAFYILVPGKKSIRYPIAIAMVTFVYFSVIHLETSYVDGLKLQVLDAGQGQSALFLLGNSLILSDCGGNTYYNAGNIAADAINDLGRNSLDLLVISHCDLDHVNGVATLMDRVRVDAIAMPPLDETDWLQNEIARIATEAGTELLYIEDKVEWKVEEDKYVTLFPPVGSGGSNERGLSLLATAGTVDVLVLGDMNMETERLFMERFSLPEMEVLFAPHHGSKYSSSDLLLEHFRDQIAIICVGSNNYGHPTKEVLEKMEDYNIEVFRTDTMGAIVLDCLF